jgi:hypothetical protein
MRGVEAMNRYTARKLFKTKILLALPLIAIFAIPGSAGQPNLTPAQRLAAMQSVLGVALDPHGDAPFSIELPELFAAEHVKLALKFS